MAREPAPPGRVLHRRLTLCGVAAPPRCAGTIKQTLPFDDATGGGPVVLSCNRDFLAAATAAHTLRVFKVAGREAKPHQGPGAQHSSSTVALRRALIRLADLTSACACFPPAGVLLPPELGGASLVVDVMRVNSSGNMVAVLCSSKERSREPRLYVHCFENQTTLVYDFEKVRERARVRAAGHMCASPAWRRRDALGAGDTRGAEAVPAQAALDHCPWPSAALVLCATQENRLPQGIAWDLVESKVLAVQTLVRPAASPPADRRKIDA